MGGTWEERGGEGRAQWGGGESDGSGKQGVNRRGGEAGGENGGRGGGPLEELFSTWPR